MPPAAKRVPSRVAQRNASMSHSLFGVETEYACVPVVFTDANDEVGTVPDQLMDLARRTLVHLPDRRSPGMFLGNGARFHVDCGSHPEYATPECDNPWDVVRHVLAGDCILASLAADVASNTPSGDDVLVFKSNVDLSGSGSTWGCHESYLHRVTQKAIAPQIIPHLVSRIIYTGAGGFHPLSPGLEFSVSPRVAHITRTTSSDSTSNRGIFHTKHEALAKGYHRLHILCGESLCSHLAAWLKAGTTAIIVALVDAGINPWQKASLRIPVKAFRTFAADHTSTAEVELTSREAVTAIEIQQAYLSKAEANLGQSLCRAGLRTSVANGGRSSRDSQMRRHPLTERSTGRSSGPCMTSGYDVGVSRGNRSIDGGRLSAVSRRLWSVLTSRPGTFESRSC